MTYVADPGEVNDVSFSRHERGYLVWTDLGANVRVGTGCERISAHQAYCPGGHGNATVSTGDGDDRISGSCCVGDQATLGPVAIYRADLGPGDDYALGIPHVVGGPGADRLVGTEDDDVLLGGLGPDRLEGLERDDLLEGADSTDDPSAPAEADVVDGGPGYDRVSYDGTRQSVRVDIPARLATQAGTADQLIDIEDAIGGLADDDLVGDDARNLLFGGGGQDHLVGGAGNDYLIGGSGFDAFDAGPGNDVLDGTNTAMSVCCNSARLYRIDGDLGDSELDASPELLSCGVGVDAVHDIRADQVPPSCEGGTDQARRPIVFPDFVRPNGVNRFTVPCNLKYQPVPTKPTIRCDGRISVARIDNDWTNADVSAATRRFRTRRSVARVRLPAFLRYDTFAFDGDNLMVTISYRDPYHTTAVSPSYLVHSRYLMWLPHGCDLKARRCGATAQTP
jgi:hypothetical protein